MRTASLMMALQAALGLFLAFIGGQAWYAQREVTDLLFFCGLAVHGYGVITTGFGVGLFMQVRDFDFAAPVVEAQIRLAKLERTMVYSGWLVGATLLMLWLPVFGVLLFWLSGSNILSAPEASSWVLSNLAFGALAVAGIWGTRAWARASGSTGIAEAIDRFLAGDLAERARRHLRELGQFRAD